MEEKELSEDMRAVGLIFDKLCEILSEKLGFDVDEELRKRIEEAEVVDE